MRKPVSSASRLVPVELTARKSSGQHESNYELAVVLPDGRRIEVHPDGTGLWICGKRLEKGRFTWPHIGDAQGEVVLSHEELSLLLGGIDLAKTKHNRWYRKGPPEGHAAPMS